ncbi:MULTISPECIES: hypothetical protein [unclassified Mesorhizobium]|uniref:hypothetical protein n=1 Tax=unclassified Mesorhizobium TaxID=325217 RepID=UPI002478D227|nr:MULTISPECIES: hypothetical protein [unclassified Mesorhizobium]
MRARFGGCSFRWDPALDVEPSVAEQRVFDEAAQFGICWFDDPHHRSPRQFCCNDLCRGQARCCIYPRRGTL